MRVPAPAAAGRSPQRGNANASVNANASMNARASTRLHPFEAASAFLKPGQRLLASPRAAAKAARPHGIHENAAIPRLAWRSMVWTPLQHPLQHQHQENRSARFDARTHA